MGIAGLLPELRSITKPTSLQELSGKTCAVDIYAWIHRGVFSCAMDLCLKRDNLAYVTYCQNMLSLLLQHGIKPILVFDGHRLAAKQATERDREQRREAGLKQAQDLLAQGRDREAHTAFTKAVDVTAEMARKVLLAVRRGGTVECIVAPYESDAQLAKLYRDGMVDFIISEDSDLLAFGCDRVLYKLDRHSARGEMVDLALLAQCTGNELHTFSRGMFLDFCVLAGCDYLPSVRGVGVKRAMQLVSKYKTTKRILRGLRFEYDAVPAQYDEHFYRARLTFLHQVVYCTTEKKFVHLAPLPPVVSTGTGDEEEAEMTRRVVGQEEDWSFVGRCDLARDRDAQWACGDVHPVTLADFPVSVLAAAAAAMPLLQQQPTKPQQPTLDRFFGAAPTPQRPPPPSTTTTTNPWAARQQQQQQPSAAAHRPLVKSAHFPAATSGGGPPSAYGKIRVPTKVAPFGGLVFPPLPPRQPSSSSSLLLSTPAALVTVAAVSSSPPRDKRMRILDHMYKPQQQ